MGPKSGTGDFQRDKQRNNGGGGKASGSCHRYRWQHGWPCRCSRVIRSGIARSSWSSETASARWASSIAVCRRAGMRMAFFPAA